ncbi:hypothetical protein [Actinacidiphila yeochonensis]|uniref:hypothetical protein n=1 Tax=Actinacidiphila yeochonensis TaxID=89050 RepID=UPI000561FCC2|nr:hypothetical protein [Actinacidiphila yeochonensis]
MSTRTSHLGQRQPRPTGPRDPDSRADGTRATLPWWALALPAAAFFALLALLDAGPARGAGSGAGAAQAAHLATALGTLLSRLA